MNVRPEGELWQWTKQLARETWRDGWPLLVVGALGAALFTWAALHP